MARDWTGKNNPKYNPKLSDKERAKRKHNYQVTRVARAVKDRDSYTCCICGAQKETMAEGRIETHHFFSWCSYPEYRFDMEKIVTICSHCHKEFHHIFGRKTNTEKQFEIFLEQKKKAFELFQK